MLHNKHLKLQAQQVIMNVLHYFERERDNGSACAPFASVMQHTAEACGIRDRTLTNIKKRFSDAAPNQPEVSFKRKRNKAKSSEVDDYIKDFVKHKVYEMHSKRCHLTVATLKREISEAGVFNFSSASLTWLLHSIGFAFTKDHGRRGLYELDHIASSRVRFLRDYNTNKQSKDYDHVFLDETWIFSRGSPKKSWHDNTLKTHKNIKLFITQGGLQSIEEAIYTYLPMVGLPILIDQGSNLKRLEHHGICLALDYKTMTKESFKSAIMEVIENKSYKEKIIEMVKLAVDQPQTGLDRALWWTEYIIRHKGTQHMKSPIKDIPWYQLLLLDVISVIILVSILVLLIVKAIGKLCYNMLCKRSKEKVKKA
ncbi:hypothetical protein FQA39_LY15953 [Lamprigera yunnana]|nr:hypothetical protein FQA39_LY15953 [Lamprigera yunnana]